MDPINATVLQDGVSVKSGYTTVETALEAASPDVAPKIPDFS